MRISEEIVGLQVNAFLGNLGDSCKLNFPIDLNALTNELEKYKSDWTQYNPYKPQIARKGLSLTSRDGKISGGENLASLRDVYTHTGQQYREKDFSIPTAVAETCQSLKNLLQTFAPLGRSHFIELGHGGFFPPHRDLDHECFRIIAPCFNCQNEDYAFIVDGLRLQLEPGWPYYVNTRKVHSLQSFREGNTFLILNIPATLDNFTKILKNLFIK